MRSSLRALARFARAPLISGLVATALAAAAQAESAPTLRLAEVVDAALRDNPAIATARYQARAMHAVPEQVSAYDDPTLSWEAWDIPESLRIDKAENNIFRLSQKLPYPGKRTLAGERARRDAAVADEDVHATELEVRAAVTRVYTDLWLAYERRTIYQRDKALLARVAHAAETQYAIGQTSQADVLRAQVELTHMVLEESTAALAIEGARASLNAVLSRTADAPLGMPEAPVVRPLDASLDAFIERALRGRPELAAQRAAIGRETTGVELAKLNSRPDFEVSIGRFVNYGRNDGFGAMASVTLPFVHTGKYDAAVGEARARVSGAESDLRRLQDGIRREVAESYTMARTAALQYDLARTTHVPHAEQTVQVSEAAYVSGAVEFGTLIDALRTVQATHLQHAEYAATYQRAIADLERAVGGPLDAAPTP